MRTKILSTFFMCFIILIALSQEKKTACSSHFKPEVRETEDIHIVYYEFTGPYKDSFNDFGMLMAYLKKNEIELGAYSLGVFYDDPAEVPAEKLRSEPAHAVTGPVEVGDGFKYKKIPAGKAVSVKYTSMEEIMPAYEAIGKYIVENELKTVTYSIEIYYSYDENTMDVEILMMLAE